MVDEDLGQGRASERLMNIQEAADFMGVMKQTLYSWAHQRKIPFVKVGRLLRFRWGDIKGWLDAHAVQPMEI